MAKFKQILKRTLGGLKLAAALAPVLMFFGGVGVGISCCLASAITDTVTVSDYKSTDNYIKTYSEDIEEINESYRKGKITAQGHDQSRTRIESNEYAKEVLAQDEGNADFKARLKTSEDLFWAGVSGFLCMGAGVGLGVTWVSTPILENLLKVDVDSAPPPVKPKRRAPLKASCEDEDEIIEDIE